MRESAAGPIGTGFLLGMIGFCIVWLVQLPFSLAGFAWARRYDVVEIGYLEWLVEEVFALTGKIKNTGLIEVPMGTSLRTIIEQMGGGMSLSLWDHTRITSIATTPAPPPVGWWSSIAAGGSFGGSSNEADFTADALRVEGVR